MHLQRLIVTWYVQFWYTVPTAQNVVCASLSNIIYTCMRLGCVALYTSVTFPSVCGCAGVCGCGSVGGRDAVVCYVYTCCACRWSVIVFSVSTLWRTWPGLWSKAAALSHYPLTTSRRRSRLLVAVYVLMCEGFLLV